MGIVEQDVADCTKVAAATAIRPAVDIRAISALASEHTTILALAAAILAEYERAWADMRNGSKVRDALAFEDWEHFWIACYPPSGSVRIARRRLRLRP